MVRVYGRFVDCTRVNNNEVIGALASSPHTLGKYNMPGNLEFSRKEKGGWVGKSDGAAILCLALLELELYEEYTALEGKVPEEDLCQSAINLAHITHDSELMYIVVVYSHLKRGR